MQIVPISVLIVNEEKSASYQNELLSFQLLFVVDSDKIVYFTDDGSTEEIPADQEENIESIAVSQL